MCIQLFSSLCPPFSHMSIATLKLKMFQICLMELLCRVSLQDRYILKWRVFIVEIRESIVQIDLWCIIQLFLIRQQFATVAVILIYFWWNCLSVCHAETCLYLFYNLIHYSFSILPLGLSINDITLLNSSIIRHMFGLKNDLRT